MSPSARLLLTSLLATSTLAGCKKEETPIVPPPPQAPAGLKAPEPAAGAEAPADPGSSERAEAICAAKPAEGTPETLSLAGRKATRNGTTLTFSEPDADGALVLGVLGPINEDSGANRLALRKYARYFEEQKVDAILVTGDVGEVTGGITQALLTVAESKTPVFVVAGNRECAADYDEGVRAAQAKAPNIVNLNAVRKIVFPEATLVSIPGHHDPDFINCESGCRYYPSTVDEAVALSKGAEKPVVLVAHGPPHGQGSQALDYAKSNANVGADEITRAIREGNIPFGVFSNIKEAGARATDLAGTTVIPQGKAVGSLFLNPGPADTTDWAMNDGTVSHGFAAVLRVEGKQGSWNLYRAQALTAAEKKEAKKLVSE
jgi:Icc-related predicted phosphoesterase